MTDKVKVKVDPVHVMKTYIRVEVELHSVNAGEWLDSSPGNIPRRQNPVRGILKKPGSRSGHFGEEKLSCSCRESNRDSPVLSSNLATTPIALSPLTTIGVFEFLYFPSLKPAASIPQFHPQWTAFRLFFSACSTIYPHSPPIVSIELSPSISSRDKYHAMPGSFLFQSIILFVLLSGSPHRVLWTPTIPPHTTGTALA